MTLKQKILLGYGFTFFLMLLITTWAIVNLISLGKASDRILKENYRSILASENMIGLLERQDSGILLILLGDVSIGVTQFQNNETEFYQWLERAKNNITIEGESELISSIEKLYAEYNLEHSKLILKPDKNKYFNTIYPLFTKIRNLCSDLRSMNEKIMYGASLNAQNIANRAILSTSVVTGTTLLLALIFSFLLSGKITKPLKQLMEASKKIATGNYNVEISQDTGDELGLLAKEFNQMARQVSIFHEMNIENIIFEKKRSDAILFCIDDGLIVLDKNLRITSLNPAANQMLGIGYKENRTIYISDVLDNEKIHKFLSETINNGIEPKISEEERIISVKAGDKTHHYLFSVSSISGKEKDLTGIVLLLRDVTRLKEVDRLKSEFVMAASHELRTPLTSIGMSVDLLLEHVSPNLKEEDLELLKAAQEEVRRLKSLISDLLDLSKIEAGRIEMDFASISVQSIVERNIKTIFKGQLANKSVKLTTRLEKDLPSVRADANKITWVITNLVSNALRYVKQDGDIEIAGYKVGNYVHLAVIDDGPGIPSEYQTKIFHKFVKINKDETEGTGLGLSICKEIIRAHGGTIWVESQVGKGSKFTFTLPLSLSLS